MEYEFDIVCWHCIKHQSADVLSLLNIEGTDESDIDDNIPIMAVVIRAQLGQDKHVRATPDMTLVETIKQILPTL